MRLRPPARGFGCAHRRPASAPPNPGPVRPTRAPRSSGHAANPAGNPDRSPVAAGGGSRAASCGSGHAAAAAQPAGRLGCAGHPPPGNPRPRPSAARRWTARRRSPASPRAAPSPPCCGRWTPMSAPTSVEPGWTRPRARGDRPCAGRRASARTSAALAAYHRLGAAGAGNDERIPPPLRPEMTAREGDRGPARAQAAELQETIHIALS